MWLVVKTQTLLSLVSCCFTVIWVCQQNRNAFAVNRSPFKGTLLILKVNPKFPLFLKHNLSMWHFLSNYTGNYICHTLLSALSTFLFIIDWDLEVSAQEQQSFRPVCLLPGAAFVGQHKTKNGLKMIEHPPRNDWHWIACAVMRWRQGLNSQVSRWPALRINQFDCALCT